jgi:LiaF transmembrane domain
VARPFRSEGLVLGLLLVAVGLVWMAANLGKLDLLSTLRTWWPASLVVWGVVELVAFAVSRAGEREPRGAEAAAQTLKREDS